MLSQLTHICNLSLQKGIFPDQMKSAQEIPIYKSGKTDELGNYRPISLLPQFSKMIEKEVIKECFPLLINTKY